MEQEVVDFAEKRMEEARHILEAGKEVAATLSARIADKWRIVAMPNVKTPEQRERMLHSLGGTLGGATCAILVVDAEIRDAAEGEPVGGLVGAVMTINGESVSASQLYERSGGRLVFDNLYWSPKEHGNPLLDAFFAGVRTATALEPKGHG